MQKCCEVKFNLPNFRDLLLITGDANIHEDSPRDYYWGVGKDHSGKNMLGKLLMEIRSQI